MGPTRQIRRRRLAIACGTLLVAIAWAAGRPHAAPPETPPARARPHEIRFGVIEPPVVAQHDITVRAPTSNQQLEPKPLECSGMVWADAGLIICSDRHTHILFTCPVDLGRMTIGSPEPHVVVRNEQELLDDAECLAIRPRSDGRTLLYATCSLSNDLNEVPLPMRRHMLRLALGQPPTWPAERITVFGAGPVRDALDGRLKAARVPPYRTYNGDFAGPDKNTYRWGNVEGMAFTPDGSRVLCGMRNPLCAGRAILFVLEGIDVAFDARDAARLRLTDLFTLDLGERGVSDLAWDGVTRGYLITAAKSNGPKLNKDEPFPPNSLDSALFWWSGRKSEPPLLVARMPDMTIEAVCRLGSSRFIALGSDEGDVSEGRAQRQSIVTVLDFTGVPQEP
jgi:hypothetical protein